MDSKSRPYARKPVKISNFARGIRVTVFIVNMKTFGLLIDRDECRVGFSITLRIQSYTFLARYRRRRCTKTFGTNTTKRSRDRSLPNDRTVPCKRNELDVAARHLCNSRRCGLTTGWRAANGYCNNNTRRATTTGRDYQTASNNADRVITLRSRRLLRKQKRRMLTGLTRSGPVTDNACGTI